MPSVQQSIPEAITDSEYVFRVKIRSEAAKAARAEKLLSVRCAAMSAAKFRCCVKRSQSVIAAVISSGWRMGDGVVDALLCWNTATARSIHAVTRRRQCNSENLLMTERKVSSEGDVMHESAPRRSSSSTPARQKAGAVDGQPTEGPR